LKPLILNENQQGIALVVALLFLLVLTMLSVFAATNSSLELKMAGNMQDASVSFQSAEAGAIATLALANTVSEPFDGLPTNETMHRNDTDNIPGWDPFIDWVDTAIDHPLRNVSGTPVAMNIMINLTASANNCPRVAKGYSADLFRCDHYDIESQHSEAHKASTKVHLGVVKTIINKVPF